MSAINTGGPAFPHKMYLGERWNQDKQFSEPFYSEQPGAVTLRDYLAAGAKCGETLNQPMGEIIAGRPMPSMETDPVSWLAFWFEVEVEARIRYMKADAMLSAREKGGAS